MFPGKIPFDIRGNLVNSGPYTAVGSTLIWKDNFVFTSEMTIVSLKKGRSGTQHILQDHHGRQYNVFPTDMFQILQRTTIVIGTIQPTNWTFCKRGFDYGLQLA